MLWHLDHPAIGALRASFAAPGSRRKRSPVSGTGQGRAAPLLPFPKPPEGLAAAESRQTHPQGSWVRLVLAAVLLGRRGRMLRWTIRSLSDPESLGDGGTD